jgi:hypothetical protein
MKQVRVTRQAKIVKRPQEIDTRSPSGKINLPY